LDKDEGVVIKVSGQKGLLGDEAKEEGEEVNGELPGK
jgi:hypothetical protein